MKERPPAWLDPDRPPDEDELAAAAREENDDGAAPLRPLVEEEPPNPRFTARVMAAVGEQRPGLFARLRDALLRPRELRVSAAAALAASAAVAMLLGIALTRNAAHPTVQRIATPAPPPLAAPRSAAPSAIPVRFALAAPSAHSVAVAGDFTDWDPAAVALADPDGDGVWEATVPLPPGRHSYMFVVDGARWVIDPEAEALQPDGFGSENAVLYL